MLNEASVVLSEKAVIYLLKKIYLKINLNKAKLFLKLLTIDFSVEDIVRLRL